MQVYHAWIWVVSEISETLHSRTTLECYFGFKHLRRPLSYLCLFGWKMESDLNKVQKKWRFHANI